MRSLSIYKAAGRLFVERSEQKHAAALSIYEAEGRLPRKQAQRVFVCQGRSPSKVAAEPLLQLPHIMQDVQRLLDVNILTDTLFELIIPGLLAFVGLDLFHVDFNIGDTRDNDVVE
ncbi:MAG: hypothetical protein ACI81P_001628 [Neolewinella sp.]